MADEPTIPDVAADNNAAEMNTPTPSPVDPGGAHAKGYSADPRPGGAAKESDPVPLAKGPDERPAVRVPERDNHVQPTGRSEPGDYTPNDRLMGADR